MGSLRAYCTRACHCASAASCEALCGCKVLPMWQWHACLGVISSTTLPDGTEQLHDPPTPHRCLLARGACRGLLRLQQRSTDHRQTPGDYRRRRRGLIAFTSATCYNDRAMNGRELDIWYRQGLRFSCRQCGRCCTGSPGYVFVTRNEIDKIAAFIGRPGKGLTKTHLRRIGLRHCLTEDAATGDCCFLDRRDGRLTCRVYPVRPLQCRTWPFWPGNLRSSQEWAEAAEVCPGINQGPVHDLLHVQACRTARRWEDVPQCPPSC